MMEVVFRSIFKPVLAACILLLAESGFAGAANAQLQCTGKHGAEAVALSGEIPGDFADFQLALDFQGHSLRMQSEQDTIAVAATFRKRSFSLTVTRSDGSTLRLQALPQSMRSKGSLGAGELKASFQAVLRETPMPEFSPLRGMQLLCHYDYSI